MGFIDIQRRQELHVPFRGQRRRQRDGKIRPLHAASPPARLDAGEDGQRIGAADDHERNDGSTVTQGHFYEVIAAKALQLVGVAMQGKSTFHAFGQDTEDFISFKDAGGICPVGKHTAHCGDESGDGTKFEQAGVNQEAWDASAVTLDEVQNHDGVKGDESAMVADEDGAALAGKVLQAGGFDAPVIFREEIEKEAAAMDVGEVGGGKRMLQWNRRVHFFRPKSPNSFYRLKELFTAAGKAAEV